MDENLKEKLRDFEKIWQRVSAAREEKECSTPPPLKLMPNRAKDRRPRRYIPYSPY